MLPITLHHAIQPYTESELRQHLYPHGVDWRQVARERIQKLMEAMR